MIRIRTKNPSGSCTAIAASLEKHSINSRSVDRPERKQSERGVLCLRVASHDWQVLIAKKAASVTLITSQRDAKKRALTRSNLCKNLQNSSEHRGLGQTPKRFG